MKRWERTHTHTHTEMKTNLNNNYPAVYPHLPPLRAALGWSLTLTGSRLQFTGSVNEEQLNPRVDPVSFFSLKLPDITDSSCMLAQHRGDHHGDDTRVQ